MSFVTGELEVKKLNAALLMICCPFAFNVVVIIVVNQNISLPTNRHATSLPVPN